ncbi:MAG: site-specific integrase, partial [Planctomycetota bacterium]
MTDQPDPLRARDRALLTEFLELLRVEGGLSRHTIEAYARDLTRFLGELGEDGVTLEALGTDRLVEHLGSLRRAGAADASVARALAAIRSFLHFLVAEGELHQDASARVPTPKLARTLPVLLDIDQVDRLLTSANGSGWRDQRDRALLEVLYACGARVSECIGLTLDVLPPGLREVRLHGKGDKIRMVPLGARAAEALRHWIDDGRPQVKGAIARREVFVTARGTPLTRQGAWR